MNLLYFFTKFINLLKEVFCFLHLFNISTDYRFIFFIHSYQQYMAVHKEMFMFFSKNDNNKRL